MWVERDTAPVLQLGFPMRRAFLGTSGWDPGINSRFTSGANLFGQFWNSQMYRTDVGFAMQSVPIVFSAATSDHPPEAQTSPPPAGTRQAGCVGSGCGLPTTPSRALNSNGIWAQAARRGGSAQVGGAHRGHALAIPNFAGSGHSLLGESAQQSAWRPPAHFKGSAVHRGWPKLGGATNSSQLRGAAWRYTSRWLA